MLTSHETWRNQLLWSKLILENYIEALLKFLAGFFIIKYRFITFVTTNNYII